MGKNKLRRKVKRRHKSVFRWIEGRNKNNLDGPTEREVGFFKAGFNMGWKEKIDDEIQFNRH